MTTNDREKALLEVIRQGLEVCGESATKNMLGDRSGYIGVSDLAQFVQCPRKAILSKYGEIKRSIQELVTLQRGHWFETGIKDCFKGLGMNFFHQLEISHKTKSGEIKAHLDFTIVWEKPYPAVRILEIKSTDRLPETPCESHLFQTQAQVNFLHRFWGKPVFSLKNESGELLHNGETFPQICNNHFGINLPENPDKISVENWLLYISMKDVRAFGPYLYNRTTMKEALKIAGDFWRQLKLARRGELARDTMEFAQGFYPLCSWCQFNFDCPKFMEGSFQPEWEDVISQLDSLKEQRTEIDLRVRDIETALKQAGSLSNSHDWINTGSHRFRTSNVAGRKTLDTGLLKEELGKIFTEAQIGGVDIQELFANCTRTGEPSSRLTVMLIN